MLIDDQKTISFVVPVYNDEKYVARCVSSILDQTYSKIEVILIDDGSTDDSGKIIDSFEKKDNRVKVIHQTNAGVSAARNKGIDNSSGEYIMFVDADDYIEKDYAEYFIWLLSSTKTEYAIGMNHFSVDSNHQVKTEHVSTISKEQATEYIYLGKINVAVWNKIFKKSLILDNHLSFNPDIWYGEGMLFNIQCLQCVDCVAVGERKVYHQVFNPKSAMRNFNLKSNYCGIKSLDLQRKTIKNFTPEIKNAWTFHYNKFYQSILTGLVTSGTTSKHKDVYIKCKKGMLRGIPSVWKVPISLSDKIKTTLYFIFPLICAKRRQYKNQKYAIQQEKQ